MWVTRSRGERSLPTAAACRASTRMSTNEACLQLLIADRHGSKFQTQNSKATPPSASSQEELQISQGEFVQQKLPDSNIRKGGRMGSTTERQRLRSQTDLALPAIRQLGRLSDSWGSGSEDTSSYLPSLWEPHTHKHLARRRHLTNRNYYWKVKSPEFGVRQIY